MNKYIDKSIENNIDNNNNDAKLTYNWNKMYPREFVSSMAEHSAEIVGLWARCWCYLAISKPAWVKSADQAAWARMLGIDKHQVKNFMNYIQDNFNCVSVKTQIIDYNKIYYSVCDEWYAREEKTRKNSAARMRRHRKQSSLALNRVSFLEKIINIYHPKKAIIQLTMARNEFIRYMRDCSRSHKMSEDKIAAEKAGAELIMQYIKYLEKTPEWNESDGKYLLGIGNLIKSRVWEVDDVFIKLNELENTSLNGEGKSRETLKNVLVDL